MLVLSRHVDEEIILECPDGTIIKLRPVAIRGDKVRIGLEAPDAVQIHRVEVYEAIQREKSTKPQRKAAESRPVPA